MRTNYAGDTVDFFTGILSTSKPLVGISVAGWKGVVECWKVEGSSGVLEGKVEEGVALTFTFTPPEHM